MAHPFLGGLLLFPGRRTLLVGVHALAVGSNLGVLRLGLQPLGFNVPFLGLQFRGIGVGLGTLCGVLAFAGL